MTVLAIACKGKEFLYNVRSAHEVSKASADWICNVLNQNRYKLKEGEVWHKFTDICFYDTAWSYAKGQVFKKYKNQVKSYTRW